MYLFLLGVASSLAWHLRADVNEAFQRVLYGQNRSRLSVLASLNIIDSPRLAIAETPSETPEEFHHKLREMQSDERVQFFVGRLVDGSRSSLRYLETSYLERTPEYQTDILPALKAYGLRILLERFTEADWENWQNITRGKAGATPARQFLDLVAEVNPDLTNYLETSAQSFQGIFTMTRKGKVYDLNRDLDFLAANQSMLLAPLYDPIRARSRGRMFDTTISQDQTFETLFEAIRGRFVAEYVRKHTDSLRVNNALIGSLKPRFCEADVLAMIGEHVRIAAASELSDERKSILENGALMRALEQGSTLDANLAAEVSGFFLIVSLDSVEKGDLAQARALIDRAKRLNTNQGQLDAVAMIVEQRSKEAELAAWNPESADNVTLASATTSELAYPRSLPLERATYRSLTSKQSEPRGPLFPLFLLLLGGLTLTPGAVWAYRSFFRGDRETPGHPGNSTRNRMPTELIRASQLTPPTAAQFSPALLEEGEYEEKRYATNRYR